MTGKVEKRIVTEYNSETKNALDEMTLEECSTMNMIFGTEFVCNDGHIQYIRD